jgi:hypothetical protein
MEWWDVNSLIEIQLASMNSVIPPTTTNTKWNMATCQGRKGFHQKSYAFFIVNMDETKAIKLGLFCSSRINDKREKHEMK